MSEKTWEETKAILEDPYVSADTKQLVLSAYARGGEVNDEAMGYYDRYNVSPSPFADTNAFVDTDAVYDRARQESQNASYVGRQYEQRLNSNQSELDGAQAPGEGGSGVGNADELFDLAKDALYVFEEFLPIDGEAPGDCRHIDGPLNFQQDIQKRFDEQRGIDFRKFLDEAQRLRDAHSVLEELHGTTESNLNSLYKDWTGDGANASYQKYSEDIAPNTRELLDYLKGGAEVIEATVQTIYEACKYKADEVLSLYTPTVGSALPDIARKVMKLARGEFDSQDEILEVAAWVDAETGSNIEPTIRADDCGLNDGNKTYTIEQCKTWVRNSWNPDLYDNLFQRFTQVCDDTKEAVDTAWEELNNYLKEYKSEFPEDSGTAPTDPGAGPQPGDQGIGADPGPGGAGPGAGGGSGGGPSGGGATPSIPEMEQPGDGKNPVTGDPLEVDPETGEPYPIDPETGEAIKDLGDDRDTLTVEKGDRTLELTEPDSEGRMGVTVDDGSGEPKEYELDFGTGEQGEPGEFGPQGKDGEQVYRPGPDGKIHIEDGDLRITAEQPQGPDGPTRVTVDDGNPPPTTYTLGEEQRDGAAGGAPREQLRTMPAAGENPLRPEATPTQGGASEPREGAGGPVAGGSGGGEAGSVGGIGAGGSDATGAQAAAVSPGGSGEEPVGGGPRSGVAESTPAGAGLGSAPGGMGEAPAAAPAQSGGTAAGSGMGMMGGMGAMGGAGGGQGGDQERGSSAYRIDGEIFDNSTGGSRISGSLDGDIDIDVDRSVRFDR